MKLLFGLCWAVEFFEERDGAVERERNAFGVVEEKRNREVVAKRVIEFSGGFGGLRKAKISVGADG